MDTSTSIAMSLLTLGIILRERVSGEDEALKRLLVEIKNDGKSVNYCHINEILNIRSNELYTIKEEIDGLISRVNSHDIVDDLRSMREELLELAIHLLYRQAEFQDYLFCPALQKPEHSN
ncbi:hypothetical protein [Hungatella hathewayi]